MAILEAMMAGRAILTTPVGGNPELVEQGRHGILVPAGDVDALIQAIQQLACDTNLRKTLGAAARDRAMTLFTTDVMSRKIGDVYSKLIRKQERKT
jgi:glycosyltransferase involved in cell wall biosynthesis